MTDILVTAFRPFGGDALNPTEAILSALPEEINGAHIIKLLLPVEFVEAPRMAARTLLRSRPSALLMLGQAGGRAAVTPERVSINIMDASMPDNAGFEPHDIPIQPEAPAAYFSTLPIKRMVSALTAEGLPAAVSNSAGTYVCNSVMFGALHAIAERGPDIPAGFVHFPFIREQAENVPGREHMPFMELPDEIRAAEIMLRLLAEYVKEL